MCLLVKISFSVCLCVFSLLWVAGKEPASPEEGLLLQKRPPNIVFIYADDLGAGMIGHYGQEIVKTPHIDSLAQQGLSFTRAYSSIYCCPARASLLMGVHDSHQGSYTETSGGMVLDWEKTPQDISALNERFEKNQKIKPSEKEVFLPELLKKAGYVTGQFGKLEWGFMTSHKELKRHGWDSYVGYYDHQRAHGYYPAFLWKNGQKLPLDGNFAPNAGKTLEDYSAGATVKRRDRTGKKTYAPDIFLKEALGFMEENQKKPFFLFFATTLPHGPVDINPEDHLYEGNAQIERVYGALQGSNKEAKSAAAEYASMVAKLDAQVGALQAKVQDLGLEKETIFIFSADNGHEIYYRTDKGRGRSLDCRGGGLSESGQVPLLLDVFQGTRARWSGLEGKGVSLAGQKWTSYEGGVHVPLIICGKGRVSQGAVSSRLVAGYDHFATLAQLAGIPASSLPQGKDSLSYADVLSSSSKGEEPARVIVVGGSVISSQGYKLFREKGKWFLFDLKQDPEERVNLAEENNSIFLEMKKAYEQEINSPRKDKV